MSARLPLGQVIAVTIVFLSTVGALMLPAQAQEPSPLVPAEQYQNAEHGIEFTPPPGWMQMRDRVPPGVVSVFIGPRTDGFSANINLTVAPTPPGMSPTAPLPASTAQELAKMLRGVFPDYKVVGTSRVRVGNEDALAVASTFTNKQPKAAARNRQIIIVHSGKIYTFTFSAHARAFKTVVPAFEQAMKTVKWLPVETAPAAPSAQ